MLAAPVAPPAPAATINLADDFDVEDLYAAYDINFSTLSVD